MSYSNGTYGTKRPANIDIDDCEIFYQYRPDRSTLDPDFTTFKKISTPDTLLEKQDYTDEGGTTAVLHGMYNLKLPLSIFDKTGIYTIYIKPKEIKKAISDSSTLIRYSNIRGIVIDNKDLNQNETENGGLVGYRVDYIGQDGERLNYSRLITSSYKCAAVQTDNSTTSYEYNNSGNQLFCTLSPSTSLSFNSNDEPYIGKEGDEIILVNTKFNPVMVEVELVEHDIETITTMLEGPQIRNLHNSTITTFNKDGEIYHQAMMGTIVNPDAGDSDDNLDHDFKIPMIDSINYGEKTAYEEIINSET